jgi:hypothetical protein
MGQYFFSLLFMLIGKQLYENKTTKSKVRQHTQEKFLNHSEELNINNKIS